MVGRRSIEHGSDLAAQGRVDTSGPAAPVDTTRPSGSGGPSVVATRGEKPQTGLTSVHQPIRAVVNPATGHDRGVGWLGRVGVNQQGPLSS